MKGKIVRFAALGAAAVIAGQFMVAEAFAAGPAAGIHRVPFVRPVTKPTKCTGVAVAGQPGTFRFVCSTLRP